MTLVLKNLKENFLASSKFFPLNINSHLNPTVSLMNFQSVLFLPFSVLFLPFSFTKKEEKGQKKDKKKEEPGERIKIKDEFVLQ